MKSLLACLALCCAASAQAYDMKKCFTYRTKDAMFRKYDFKYLAATTHPSDSVNVSVPSKTSTQEGTSKYSTQNSIQGSTMSADPGVSTNDSTASSQYSSSWGPCALFGYERVEKRDAFIATHWEELRKDVAFGGGASFDAFATLAGCAGNGKSPLLEEMRRNYDVLATPEALRDHLNSSLIPEGRLAHFCRGIVAG